MAGFRLPVLCVLAFASAYYAMNAIWDLTSHRDHFKGRGGDAPEAFFTEQDTVVLVDISVTCLFRDLPHASD